MKPILQILLIFGLIYILTIVGIESSDSAKYWEDQSASYYHAKNYDVALLCVNRALSLDPGISVAWYSKGCILYDMGKYNEAIKCYDRAIEIDPLDSNSWYNKGTTLEKFHKYQEALDCYNVVTAIEPTEEKAWISKGLAFQNLGRYEDAIYCYNEMVNRSQSPTAWINKGIALAYLGKYAEALECFNKTTETNLLEADYYTSVWIYKGLVFLCLKKPENAISCFNKSIDGKKNDREIWKAWFCKGVALRLLDRNVDADTAFNQARELIVVPPSFISNNLKIKLYYLIRLTEEYFVNPLGFVHISGLIYNKL